jgi:hypothetical protein
MAATPRDPVDVIDAVLDLIPETWAELRRKLEYVKNDAGFVAPECVGIVWRRLADALQILPWPPTEDWHRDVYRVVTMKEPPSEKGAK